MRSIERLAVVFLTVVSSPTRAEERRPDEVADRSATHGKRGRHDDWKVEVDLDGRRRPAILSLSGDLESRPHGRWIDRRGLSELDGVTYGDGKLSFTWERRDRRGQATTWKFKGSIEGRSSREPSRNREDGRAHPRDELLRRSERLEAHR